MLVTPSVDLPDSLLESMEAGKLVVFAGAGVSMGAPASLPNFRGLVAEIGKENGRELNKGEQPDFFLGELERSGIEIHRAAISRLGGTDVQHTPLHEALLELFPDGDHVRVVTTNMDDLFASAFRSLHKKEPKLFTAPALPLGSDFTGIVHIHGSVHDEPRRTVFTDEDFGRAYLTEGWARRFLLDLFRSYTVLFVGYSHDDTVLTYLARGLPPKERGKRENPHDTLPERFSLIPKGRGEKWDQRWTSLGISVLPYRKKQGKDSHSELLAYVRELAWYGDADYLDHKRRISEIVNEGTPVSISRSFECRYLKWQLRDEGTARFFADAAAGKRATQWLQWVMDNIDAFRRIFDQTVLHLSGAERVFSGWFARQILLSFSERALRIYQKMSKTLSPGMWNEIAWTLWQDRSRSNRRVSPRFFRQWSGIPICHNRSRVTEWFQVY